MSPPAHWITAMNISLQPRNWNGKENFKHEKPFKKKNSERAPSGIRKISGGLDFNDQHHRVVSGFLVAGVSMLQAYNEGFEKYNIEDGNFRVKKELIRQCQKKNSSGNTWHFRLSSP